MKKVIYGVVVLAAFALLIGGFAWESAKEAEDALAEITYELVLEEGADILQAPDMTKKYDLGEEIPLYYVMEDNTIYRSEFLEYYPVFSDDRLIGTIAARATPGGGVNLEYLQDFTRPLQRCYSNQEEVCLFLDKDSLWLSAPSGAEKLFWSDHEEKNRGTFDAAMREDPAVQPAKLEKEHQ
ncbi:MAG: hypothetical protein SOW80_02880 [Anaerovoracaceae bacterium]|nr:hypothetical protein [Anaerovoracaceae bacterium]